MLLAFGRKAGLTVMMLAFLAGIALTKCNNNTRAKVALLVKKTILRYIGKRFRRDCLWDFACLME